MKTYTRWKKSIRPGETIESRDGTIIQNLSPGTIQVLIQTPIKLQNEKEIQNEFKVQTSK